MEQTVYHVLLEGRTVGPYDRRTIVGMRIKMALTSEHVLVCTDGAKLTVADLIGKRPAPPFNPERSGSFSVVQATFPASLLGMEGKGVDIPRFKGEVEVRVQADVLRIAGRFRHGFGWKEGRVKIVLKDIIHARVSGTQVDFWVRPKAGQRMPRVSLELFTPEAAGDMVDWLPAATPLPASVTAAPPPDGKMLWVAAAGLAAVLVLGLAILVALLQQRSF
ncbi:MAG: hypothetical protein ABIR26_11880 [Ramlibacter sp.]